MNLDEKRTQGRSALVFSVDALTRIERSTETLRNSRDRTMARLHADRIFTHEELAEIVGLSISGARAAVDRGRSLPDPDPF